MTDASLMMSPSLVGRLDEGSELGLDDSGVTCVVTSGQTTMMGQLISIFDVGGKKPGLSVTMSTSLASLHDALGIGEISKVEISNGPIPVISRDIPSSWAQSREVRPMATGLLVVLSFSQEDT